MSFCPKMWYTYKWPLQFRIILIRLFSFDIWICLENGDTVPQNCHFDGENDDQPSNFAVYFGRTHVKKNAKHLGHERTIEHQLRLKRVPGCREHFGMF